MMATGLSSGKQPTPDLSHLSSAEYEHVYEPSDDTFLLLDALESDKSLLLDTNPTLCVEVGYVDRKALVQGRNSSRTISTKAYHFNRPGSGCVITFLAQMLGKSRCYMAIDINRHAAHVTTRTASQNQVSIEVINGNLLDPVKRLDGQVDLLIFNPPYVPTPDDELGRTDLVAAWAGGKDGTDSLDLLMPQIANALSPHGLFYVVILAQNKPNEVSRRMKSHGFPHAKVVMKQQIIGELLYIVRFSRVDEASLRGQFTPT